VSVIKEGIDPTVASLMPSTPSGLFCVSSVLAYRFFGWPALNHVHVVAKRVQ
jgi:hypothetical protein